MQKNGIATSQVQFRLVIPFLARGSFEAALHERDLRFLAREQFHFQPFMDKIARHGLSWHMAELKAGDQDEWFAVNT